MIKTQIFLIYGLRVMWPTLLAVASQKWVLFEMKPIMENAPVETIF
jgi:hypothetical protein